MPSVRAEIKGQRRVIDFAGGVSLRHILESSGLVVRTGCNGNGTCGLCSIKVAGDGATPLTRNEFANLSEERIANGYRLACQFVPVGDIEIILPQLREGTEWRSLGSERTRTEGERPYRLERSGYGIAADVGTSRIRVSLVDLASGRRLAGMEGRNPQTIYGLDILSRLVAIRDGPGTAGAMRDATNEAVACAILRLCSSNGIDPDRIDRVMIVGNTAMMLMLGTDDPEILLETERWSHRYGMKEYDEMGMPCALRMGEMTDVRMAPPLAGFIGSDLTADVVSTGLINGQGPNLIVDLGTNNEICLFDGHRAFIASCAGGPALEGVGIGCCTPADWGSACHARLRPDGTFDLTVLGGGSAEGLCGSAMIDVLAELVRVGALDKYGNFTDGTRAHAITGDGRFNLTKADVDKIMRAKSAIATGLQVLFNRSGVRPDSLQRIFVTGNLGQFLSLESAKQIGLLPSLDPSKYRVMSEAALIGCEDMLLSDQALAVASRFREMVELVDLVREPDFEDLFLEGLYLQPLRSAPVTAAIGLDEYIKTSQYLAGINSPEPEEEIAKALQKFMGADLVGLVRRMPQDAIKAVGWDREGPCGFADHWNSKMRDACQEVFESGFLNFIEPEEQEMNMMLIPINIERQVSHVLMVGHRSEAELDRQKMNIYLALASLIGTLLQRVRNEEELRRHRTDLVKLVEEKTEELSRSNDELEQFAYIASHDLQEPLRMVMASLGRLEKKYGQGLDAGAEEYMRMAIEGAARMRNLIDDLLAYSRVESGGGEFVEVDMDLVLTHSLQNLGPTIAANGAEITAGPLTKVYADGSQMSQVLQNLIGNAIKYHGERPPQVRIACELSPDGTEWRISVQDNGIGIDPRYHQRIFQMFQRLHPKEEYEGTGIGLAIAKRIVERHGGRIWVTSKEEEGSTFFFTVPCRGGRDRNDDAPDQREL